MLHNIPITKDTLPNLNLLLNYVAIDWGDDLKIVEVLSFTVNAKGIKLEWENWEDGEREHEHDFYSWEHIEKKFVELYLIKSGSNTEAFMLGG